LSHFGNWVQPSAPDQRPPGPRHLAARLPQLRMPRSSRGHGPAFGPRPSCRVVLRDVWAAQQGLAALCWQITRHEVERLSLTLSFQPGRDLADASPTLCKGEEGLDQQLALSMATNNFCLPHGSCGASTWPSRFR